MHGEFMFGRNNNDEILYGFYARTHYFTVSTTFPCITAEDIASATTAFKIIL